MLKNTIVEFRKGRILTSEMLSALRTRTDDILKRYNEYPDGILYGLDFEIRESRLFLTAGAVKKNGRIYFLDEPINISELIDRMRNRVEKGTYCAVVLRETGKIQKAESVYSYCLEPMAVRYDEISDDMILGRFEYSERNILLSETDSPYDDIVNNLDLSKYIDISEARYSESGGNAFHPYLFRLAASFIEEKAEKTYFDFIILSMIYEKKVVSDRMLRIYIEKFSGRKCDKQGRELFRSFIETAKNAMDNFSVNEQKETETKTEHVKDLPDYLLLA